MPANELSILTQDDIHTESQSWAKMNPLSPKKLLHTKWTATVPVSKNKHFLVTKVHYPELPETKIEFVELEAIYSKQVQQIPWRQLQDKSLWIQGWK